jgi:iron complex outermembrane recepter protein
VYKTNLNKRSLRSALLLGAASVATIGIAAPAMAQSTGVETVVVTGSRIPQQGLYSSSPVTAVGQQEMKFEGTTNIENLLNNLPSVFSEEASTVSNGSTGTATVDLRGLGSQRTMVLVDGTRLMPGDVSLPVADLNQIPAALVDHVEVLTGGASAVYGSDALAGVVNFIMRKDFEGVEFDGQYSVDNAANGTSNYDALNLSHNFTPAPHDWFGGGTDDGTVILGVNSENGKGNITAYLGYRNTQAVLEAKRDFSACTLSGDRPSLACAGSSNYNRWISIDDSSAGLGTYQFFEQGTGASGTGHFVPYTGANSQKFNYGALNYLQRPDTRYTGGFFAHYEVSKMADVYTDFMFSDDHTLAQIAPSGLFLGTGKVFDAFVEVNCSNPLMTANENLDLCGEITPATLDSHGHTLFSDFGAGGPFGHGYDTFFGGKWNGAGNYYANQSLLEIGRRDIEGGNRIDDLRHTAYRMKVGAKGDLGGGWSYDAYAQYGLTLYSENYSNEFSVQRVQNSLQVDPATGECYAKEQNIDTSCVPLDIFNGIGSITPAMENYVRAQGFKQGWTQESIASASLNGDLGEWGGQSPWAKNPVAVAVGVEYRQEKLLLDTSRDFQINDLYGQGSATLPVPESGFNVSEGFGEVRIPLAQGQPFVEDLSLNGGYRYSSYSTAGGVTSFKFGGEYQPVDDVRARASYQRAVRAPNVLELFTPQLSDLFGVTNAYGNNDPCETIVTGKCASVTNHGSGILDCPASQCNQLTGGNPNVKPETSDTRSFGLVFTPTFFDGFTATVDYFAIKVKGAIGGVDPNETLEECYGASATAASEAYFCPLVHRNILGQIYAGGFVSSTTTNTGALDTKGFDFEANYNTDMADWGFKGAGSLSFNMIGTLLNKLSTTPVPVPGIAPAYDCAGLYGGNCGTPNPRWRHKLRVTWSSPWDVDLSVEWRYVGKVDFPANNIPAFNYFDLSGNWTVRDGVDLRAGVSNLFDKEPPAVGSALAAAPFGNGNTFPGTYDALGRTIFVGATIKY